MNLYLDNATEKEIQEAVFNYLIMRGHLVIRVNAGAITFEEENKKKRFVRFIYWAALGFIARTVGISDLIGCTSTGRFFALEVKKAKKYPSPAQLDFLALVTERGGIAKVIRSLEDVIEAGL